METPPVNNRRSEPRPSSIQGPQPSGLVGRDGKRHRLPASCQDLRRQGVGVCIPNLRRPGKVSIETISSPVEKHRPDPGFPEPGKRLMPTEAAIAIGGVVQQAFLDPPSNVPSLARLGSRAAVVLCAVTLRFIHRLSGLPM